MPIITINALPQPETADIPDVIKRVSIAVAEAMNIDPKLVWTTWQTIEPNHYTEGQNPAAEQQHDTHPPIVNLLAFEGRPTETIERAILAIAETLCQALNLEPGNAFITFTEAKSGWTYMGEEIRYRS
jgi:phenylpyruvate tautomerase PptA (4-oxalocrotonate tautomerase family)